jgi:hypothetical protein
MRATGSRNHRVLERASDPARAREASAFLKQEMEIETASIAFDSRTGVRCQGFYDVSASRPLPSGQWGGINVSGIWSPQGELPDYLPSLVRMAESYRINERFAAEYVRQGRENLKRMARETSEKMARSAREIRESSMAAYQERQRSQDYIDYKRTGYIRGEQEWVSQAEGGALYKSDHWGLRREGKTVIEGQGMGRQPESARASTVEGRGVNPTAPGGDVRRGGGPVFRLRNPGSTSTPGASGRRNARWGRRTGLAAPAGRDGPGTGPERRARGAGRGPSAARG